MNSPVKIAFSGMKGSGKDYCLKILFGEFNCLHYSFSDQLKKIAHDLYPWLDLDYAPEDKEKPIFVASKQDFTTPRDVWTELNRLVEIDPQVLVNRVDKEYKHDMDVFEGGGCYDYMVVKDLRPHNPEELAWCLSNGFKVIYIENGKDPIQDVSNLHVTEQGYEEIRDLWSVAQFVNNKEGEEPFREFLRQTLKDGKLK